MLFFTDSFSGTPKADGVEMTDERWVGLDELRGERLFPAFEKSLDMFCEVLRPFARGNSVTDENNYKSANSLDNFPTSGRYFDRLKETEGVE